MAELTAAPADVARIHPVPNIGYRALWDELLTDEESLRVVRTSLKEPFLSRAKTDVRLLVSLCDGTTEVQENPPVYPWLFWPLSRSSTFEYIGTSSRDVALKMVLWAVSVHDFCAAGNMRSGTADYKRRLARSFQLAALADSVAPDNDLTEYNPPMVTMRFKSVIALMLEIGVYGHEVESTAVRRKLQGMQRNIGELIRDIRTGTGLPKAWATQLTRIQDWHRRELAVMAATDLKKVVDSSGDGIPPEKIAEAYLEIETLLAGCKKTGCALYREIHHNLHVVGWKTSARDYAPTKWKAITMGTVYSTLPVYESWCSRCEKARFFDQAIELLPALRGAPHSLLSEARTGGFVEQQRACIHMKSPTSPPGTSMATSEGSSGSSETTERVASKTGGGDSGSGGGVGSMGADASCAGFAEAAPAEAAYDVFDAL